MPAEADVAFDLTLHSVWGQPDHALGSQADSGQPVTPGRALGMHGTHGSQGGERWAAERPRSAQQQSRRLQWADDTYGKNPSDGVATWKWTLDMYQRWESKSPGGTPHDELMNS